MNQYIYIYYKPKWTTELNYWNIWFIFKEREFREKVPSFLNESGWWSWRIQGKSQKRGWNFDWDKQ